LPWAATRIPILDLSWLQGNAAARNKAAPYAEAAGDRLGHVVHVEDVNPGNAGFGRYRARGVGGQAAAEDLAPGHVVVSAAVIIGFSLSLWFTSG
jgi:uncharacterized protein